MNQENKDLQNQKEDNNGYPTEEQVKNVLNKAKEKYGKPVIASVGVSFADILGFDKEEPKE